MARVDQVLELALGVDQRFQIALQLREARKGMAALRLRSSAGAPVRSFDEAFHQAGVERVAQTVLHLGRELGELLTALEPSAVVGDIGPGAHESHPSEQRIDVSLDLVESKDLPSDPVRVNAGAATSEIEKNPPNETRVGVGEKLLVIGDLARFPEQLDARGISGAGANFRVACENRERGKVIRSSNQRQRAQRR